MAPLPPRIESQRQHARYATACGDLERRRMYHLELKAGASMSVGNAVQAR
jgi:hypothetical protein